MAFPLTGCFNLTLLGVVLWTISASEPDFARAQTHCETIPAGPARTDCYIGLSRIFREKSNIAAGTAQQQADAAKLRQVTGTSVRKVKKKARHKRPAR
jgi:hypothetical protein